MQHNIYIYIAVMALATAACRVLPVTLIRRPIENQFFQSFLYLVAGMSCLTVFILELIVI